MEYLFHLFCAFYDGRIIEQEKNAAQWTAVYLRRIYSGRIPGNRAAGRLLYASAICIVFARMNAESTGKRQQQQYEKVFHDCGNFKVVEEHAVEEE